MTDPHGAEAPTHATMRDDKLLDAGETPLV